MVEELESILAAIDANYSVTRYGAFEVYTTNCYGHELVFILCGIGKVNAALHTQFIISEFAPNYVINVGVAGGLGKDLGFGDVVIASDLVAHDVDATAFGLPLGQIPRMDVFAFACNEYLLKLAQDISTPPDFKVQVGRIVSGDQFIHDHATAERIHTTFNAVACEMEGAAIMQVCYVNKVEVLVVRAISDKAGIDNATAIDKFNQLKDMVAQRSSLIVQQILLKIS